jgi:lipopolysaccharide export system protein LptA
LIRLLALLACAQAELPLLPEVARAEGLQVQGEGWRAEGASVTLAAGTATAETVAATLTPEGEADPSRALTVRAPVSEWDLRARVARFEGGVEVTRGPVVLRAPTLTVRYAGPDRVETVQATGGVEVTRGERRARADDAVLDARTGEIVLTGAPRLSEGPNVLEGTRIVLHLDDERARCEGAEGAPCRLVVDGEALR